MAQIIGYREVREYTMLFNQEEINLLYRLLGNLGGIGKYQETSNDIFQAVKSIATCDQHEILESEAFTRRKFNMTTEIKIGQLWCEISDNKIVDIGVITRKYPNDDRRIDLMNCWYARWVKTGRELYFEPGVDSDYVMIDEDIATKIHLSCEY